MTCEQCFTLSATYAIMTVSDHICIHPKGGENMGVMEEMSKEELITITIDRYAELQRIKRENGSQENRELDYSIKLAVAKLSSLGVNVEDITL